MRKCALVAALVLLSARSRTAAQQTGPPQPFRSSRDILTVTAAVRDAAGQPLTDLQPSDFSVRIDGEPRTVVAARLFGVSSAPPVAETIPQFMRATSAAPGRVVMLLVDRFSTAAADSKSLTGAASSVVDALSPADAVGIEVIPGPGGVVMPSMDRSEAERAIHDLTGAAFDLSGDAKHLLTWRQALVFDPAPPSRDSAEWAAWQTVFDAVCGETINRDCWGEVVGQAKSMLGVGRVHARALVRSLTDVLDRLQALRGPKQVVIVTSGIPVDDQLHQQYMALSARAARERVSIFVSHLDGGWFAAGRGQTFARVFNPREYAEVFTQLAASTGGSFAAGANASRVAADAADIYELGVESRPVDGDGAPHRVEVVVNRPGSRVRAPATVAARAADAGRTIEKALDQPTNIAELPLEVASYVTHSRDPEQVRVLVAARTPNDLVPSDWGFAIMDGTRVVEGRTVHVESGTAAPWLATAAVDVAPGRYRLRAAAVSPDGRTGVVDVAMPIGLRAAAGARLSDLIVGVAGPGPLQPRGEVRQDDRAAAMIELSSPRPLQGVTGDVVLTSAAASDAALHAPLTLRAKMDDQTIVVAESPLDLSAVPPGTYTATATLLRDGTPFGRVSRRVEITAGTPTVPTAPAPLASRSAPSVPRGPATRTEPETEALMERVGAYVDRYGEQASVLVAVERYHQEATETSQVGLNVSGGTVVGRAGQPTASAQVRSFKKTRTLTSEMALVRNDAAIGHWLAFRSVTDVDGKSIGDGGRLQAVFDKSVPDLDAARLITEESARYNVGPITRTFNVPTSALFFFTAANLPRFSFRRAGTERIGGVTAWKIEFHEVHAPTLIMTRTGRDVPSAGMLWVDPKDGSVLRTRLSAEGYRGDASVAGVDVTYRFDRGVQMLVPGEMREWYRIPLAQIAAEATYSEYKRFQTSIRIK